jgi:hypothetical protein
MCWHVQEDVAALCESNIEQLQFMLDGQELSGDERSLRESGVVRGARVNVLDRVKPAGGRWLKCSRGHAMDPDPRAHSYCAVCDNTGTHFHCADQCDYNICQSCADKSVSALSIPDATVDLDEMRMAMAVGLSQPQPDPAPEPEPCFVLEPVPDSDEEGVPPKGLSRQRSFQVDVVTDLSLAEIDKKVQQFCDVVGVTDKVRARRTLRQHGFVVRCGSHPCVCSSFPMRRICVSVRDMIEPPAGMLWTNTSLAPHR